jgi:hypothetical protein
VLSAAYTDPWKALGTSSESHRNERREGEMTSNAATALQTVRRRSTARLRCGRCTIHWRL